jgi:16S rRNA processing protein RimM
MPHAKAQVFVMRRAERDSWRTVGYISKPHGLQGEVCVYSLTDFPERFARGASLSLSLPDMPRITLHVAESRPFKGGYLVRFMEITTVEAADRLRGGYLQVPIDDRMPLPEDTYYIDDLIGLDVFTDTGRYLGQIEEVILNPANDIYRVGQILIPAVSEFVREIDLAARRVTIHPIPGLLPDEDE